MKSFIVMPFAEKFNDIYTIIKDTCISTSIDPVRADEIKEPGPIINQIFSEIVKASFIIAEVSDQNPNVYYEVGVAHALSKPVLLLAQSNTIKNLPFDIRHQRVLVYHPEKKSELIKNLKKHLKYIAELIVGDKKSSHINTLVTSLTSKMDNSEILLGNIIEQVKDQFGLINPQLSEYKYLDQEGISITITDDFGENVAILLDINGIIRRMKKRSY